MYVYIYIYICRRAEAAPEVAEEAPPDLIQDSINYEARFDSIL